MQVTSIRLHTGEVVSGDRYVAARDKVADWFADNARHVRAEDPYAAHVTTEQKDARLAETLAWSDAIRAGEAYGFTVWQRINAELTGECVAFLPK